MIELKAVSKSYVKDGKPVKVLDNVSLNINDGDWVTLLGGSGAGKTTLLFTLAGLLTPDSGKVLVNGIDLYALSRDERNKVRAKTTGFIFQSFHLFPHLSVIQNVMMSGGAFSDDTASANRLLEKFGLAHRNHHLPSELSIGEKQRCAIARALFTRPSIILADEPTGNLDPINSNRIVDDLIAINKEKVTIVFVTHRPPENFQTLSTSVLTMTNGTIQNP